METLKPNCGFACRHTTPGQGNWETSYVDREIKPVVKKTGEGEEDYVIINKVVETKRSVKDTIESQADDAGLEAYMKTYEMSGEVPPQVVVHDGVDDYSQMPESMAEAAAIGEQAQQAFKQLDPELTKGLSLGEFLGFITNEKVKDFYKSKEEKLKKVEEKVDESK